MSDSQLLSELATAKRDREKAKELMQTKRGEFGDARQAWRDRCTAVEEILEEICGERPLLAAIAAKASSNGPPQDSPPKKKAKRERPDAKLAGLELPTAAEQIAVLIGPEHRMLDVLGLPWETIRRLEASGIKTVGDVAGDKCPLGYDEVQIAARAFLAQNAQSPAPVSQKPPEAKPGPVKSKPAARSTAEPSWVDDDVDRELFHAIANAQWGEMIRGCATNQEIRSKLHDHWPTSARMFVDRHMSGGRHGYTMTCQRNHPEFWIGAYLGTGHKPVLDGDRLIARIRKLLEIAVPPTPADKQPVTRKRQSVITAQGTGFQTPAALKFIPEPVGGWDSASIANAADDLGTNRTTMQFCHECHGARANGTACPDCGSIRCHSAVHELMLTAPKVKAKEAPRASRRA
jgi:hypothetical protein